MVQLTYILFLVPLVTAVNVAISPGTVLRSFPHPTTFYGGFITKIYPVKFSHSTNEDPVFQQYASFCDSSTSLECTLIETITSTLSNINSRLSQLSNNTYLESDLQTNSYLNSNLIHPDRLFPQNITVEPIEEDSSEEMKLPQNVREERQVVLGSVLLFGGLFLSSWLSSSRNYDSSITELRDRVTSNQKDLIDVVREIHTYEILQSQTLTKFSNQVNTNLQTLNANQVQYRKLFQHLNKTVFKQLLLIHYLANLLARLTELKHFSLILDECRTNLLPLSVISTDQLKKDLLSTLPILNKRNHTLALPPNQISQYYHLPITRCTYNSKTHLLNIVVNIPIIPINQFFKLHELIQIPFIHNSQVCLTPTPSNSFVLQINENYHAVKSHTKFCDAGHTMCNVNHHFIAEFTITDPCLQILLRKSTIQEINLHCPLTCHDTTPNTVLVRQVSNRLFSVGNTHSDLSIVCLNKTHNVSHSTGKILLLSLCSLTSLKSSKKC